MNMKITIVTQIEKAIITVTPAKKKVGKDIIGFAEINFVDNEDNIIFIARGYTIKVKTFDFVPTFIVNAPAYKSGFKYRTSFVVESKSLWRDITKEILADFSEQTGGKQPEDYFAENVNPSDIPQ